jgi:hypothetical protein
MQPHISTRDQGATVYLDARPLSDKPLTGIGRYTARIGIALAARGVRVRFFVERQELLPPDGFDWSPDQDLHVWAGRVWQDRRLVPLAAIPEHAVGLWTGIRPPERTFPVELCVLHDLAPLIIPNAYDARIREQAQFFYAKSLLSSDAALAVSHAVKADAAWLCDFHQDRITVCHPGPSHCVLRHLHDEPVTRRSNVGVVVSTLEPRQNGPFVIDWFRSSESLPEGTELWWVGPVERHLSPGAMQDLQQVHRGRSIRFLGVVSDQELCQLYQTAGWSVYPSLYEGLGFPVIDALRHGVPVLSGGHSSLGEFAHPGVHFFDPHDPASLDRAWAECQVAGPKLVSQAELDARYHWDRVAKTTLEVARGARLDQYVRAVGNLQATH